jgi:PhnB protein
MSIPQPTGTLDLRPHRQRRRNTLPVKPIPDGYTTIAPYLIVEDAKGAIEFYKRAFDAAEHGMILTPDGRVAHAEVKIGDTVLRLCDNLPIFEARAPRELGGTTVEIFLFVNDVDAAVRKATDAGATVKSPPTTMYWGDRLSGLSDPYGHYWLIASRVEDLSPEEIDARGRAFFAKA